MNGTSILSHVNELPFSNLSGSHRYKFCLNKLISSQAAKYSIRIRVKNELNFHQNSLHYDRSIPSNTYYRRGCYASNKINPLLSLLLKMLWLLFIRLQLPSGSTVGGCSTVIHTRVHALCRYSPENYIICKKRNFADCWFTDRASESVTYTRQIGAELTGGGQQI
jgi:hypothetical protein